MGLDVHSRLDSFRPKSTLQEGKQRSVSPRVAEGERTGNGLARDRSRDLTYPRGDVEAKRAKPLSELSGLAASQPPEGAAKFRAALGPGTVVVSTKTN